ncbi:MAG TPA: ATP-binding protein [Flavipsychrobacter sp.]|nr:ATP-binding protein [Flavipsychrobacter sp.]
MFKKNVRVLIIDDDEDDFVIVSDYIQRTATSRFVTDWCPDYEKAVVLMNSKSYDIYFVDYRLGANTGVDFLKAAQAAHCEEPIILLTGKGNIKVDIEAMQLGAVDYLIKSELNVENLERSMRYALDRSLALNALKENERKYRNIFERSRDVIFLADDQLRFLDVNDACFLMLGYKKEELIGKSLTGLVKLSQQKSWFSNAAETKKEVHDREVLMEMKGGGGKNCTVTLVMEESEIYQGGVRFHGIIHDITTLKKVEKTTLQVEKLAATGRLVRTLAHEVRNPLNNITLALEQLNQGRDEEEMLYMEIIERNSRRIGDLVTELLNTSKPTDIKMNRELLQSVIDEVITKAIDRITLKKMQLRINLPTRPVYILANKDKLAVALLNIVINAIEAMEEEKGLLEISAAHPDEQTILVTIADNGCGIAEENISKLFEPYFTQKRNGMGLGLASTLNILQSHAATIEVSSTPGTGTTFTILFSLYPEEVDV